MATPAYIHLKSIAAGDRNHRKESPVLTRLTKSALGTCLPTWGSDLPTRRHAQESRPIFAKGRRMFAIKFLLLGSAGFCDPRAGCPRQAWRDSSTNLGANANFGARP